MVGKEMIAKESWNAGDKGSPLNGEAEKKFNAGLMTAWQTSPQTYLFIEVCAEKR
jgi:hypothetical protein